MVHLIRVGNLIQLRFVMMASPCCMYSYSLMDFYHIWILDFAYSEWVNTTDLSMQLDWGLPVLFIITSIRLQTYKLVHFKIRVSYAELSHLLV